MSAASNQERLMTVILGPHVSEKSTAAADKQSQVVLKVRLDATKREIRDAVELMFEVSVEGVRVVRSFGKLKRVITSYSIHYTKLYETSTHLR